MVLTDDDCATIVSAVRQGRTLYDNILKFVRFQLSTTIGAILTVFFAPLASLLEPFTPIQILWVAIIMDGPPAVSLALDAARPGILHEPPRSRAEALLLLSRLAKVIAYGITMMVGTLAVLYYGLHTGTEQRALTLAFTTFVLFQFFNVFNARNESRPSTLASSTTQCSGLRLRVSLPFRQSPCIGHRPRRSSGLAAWASPTGASQPPWLRWS